MLAIIHEYVHGLNQINKQIRRWKKVRVQALLNFEFYSNNFNYILINFRINKNQTTFWTTTTRKKFNIKNLFKIKKIKIKYRTMFRSFKTILVKMEQGQPTYIILWGSASWQQSTDTSQTPATSPPRQ